MKSERGQDWPKVDNKVTLTVCMAVRSIAMNIQSSKYLIVCLSSVFVSSIGSLVGNSRNESLKHRPSSSYELGKHNYKSV